MLDDLKTFTVRAYGHSGMLPRPGVVDDDGRYLTLLRRWWQGLPEFDDVSVIERARPRQNVETLRQWWHQDNNYFGEGSDVLITHFGANDCAPRPLRPKERSRIEHLPGPFRKGANAWVKRNRARLVRRRTIRDVPPRRFSRLAEDWLAKAAEAHSRVYVRNIMPVGPELEARSPGVGKSVAAYNELLENAVAKVGAPNIHLIDINGLIHGSGEDISEFVVPGDFHGTARHHQCVFEMIRDLEIEAGVGRQLEFAGVGSAVY